MKDGVVTWLVVKEKKERREGRRGRGRKRRRRKKGGGRRKDYLLPAYLTLATSLVYLSFLSVQT